MGDLIRCICQEIESSQPGPPIDCCQNPDVLFADSVVKLITNQVLDAIGCTLVKVELGDEHMLWGLQERPII